MKHDECACYTPRGKNISQSRIFPSGHENRKFLLRGGEHPTVGRVDLVKFLETAFFEDPIKKFVRKTALFFLCRGHPFIDDHSLDSANGFLFRDTSIGDPI